MAMSWTFTVAIGALVAFAALSMKDGLDGDALAVMSAGLFTIALERRILDSRIIVDEASLLVVNYLVTHSVPYNEISRVGSDERGSLTIVTYSGNVIYSGGFGGSVIDHFVGSVPRAVDQIECHVHRRRNSSKAKFVKKITTAWIADVSAVGALVCGIMAAVVGI